MLDETRRRLLEKQHYQLVGAHSAVKPCTWLKKALRGEGFCYKQKFYGIESHRCMQMTPAVAWCTHSCVFCWRNTDMSSSGDDMIWEEPEEIVSQSIEAHRQAISGFGGNTVVDPKKLNEALNPNQVAVSLAGEPTLYPYLSGLIGEYKKRGMTVYVVTNGTRPAAIKSLDVLPTNFYVSVVAPDELTYKRVCAPQISDGWERIQKTIELFPSLDTTTVVRVTAVKGLNIRDPKGYAKLISAAEPDFVEVKAFMYVGGSRLRLTMDNMPTHDEVRAFAREIAKELSYKVKDEKTESRVVLLSKN